METNETIVTGKKLRRFVNGAWERISFWHKASDCMFDDGMNAQEKLGNIKGITDSTSVSEHGYAADAKIVGNIHQNLTINGKTFVYDYQDGKFGYNTSVNRDKQSFNPFVMQPYDGYLIKDGLEQNLQIWGGFSTNNFSFNENISKEINKKKVDIVNENTPSNSYVPSAPYKYSLKSHAKTTGSVFSFYPINLTDYSKFSIKYVASCHEDPSIFFTRRFADGYANGIPNTGSLGIVYGEGIYEDGTKYYIKPFQETYRLRTYSNQPNVVHTINFNLTGIKGFYFLAIGFINTYEHDNIMQIREMKLT